MVTIDFTDGRFDVADHCKCPNCGSILVDCGTENCPACGEELMWFDDDEQEVVISEFAKTNEIVKP